MKKFGLPSLLAVGLALCLVSATAARSQAVFSRAERILQATTTKATFTTKGEIKKQCEDQDISSSDVNITKEKRKELRAEISGRYSGIIDTFVSASASGKDLGGAAQDNASKLVTGSNILFSAVICALSILSFFFLFLWAITECCCKKTCCVKEQGAQDGRGKVRICIWISAAVVALTSLALAIAWAAYLKQSVNTIKDAQCGVAILYSDVSYGAELSPGSVFIGIQPLKDTITKFKNSLDGVINVKTNAQNVVNKGLNNKATSTENAYNIYKVSVDGTLNTYAQAVSGTGVTISIYLKALPEVVKSALSAEVAALKDTANQIHNGCVTIKDLDTTQVTSIKKQLDSLTDQMDNTVQKNLQSMYDSLTGGNTTKTVSDVANTVFVIVLIVVIVFTVIFLAVLIVTAYLDKCHCLKFFPKIIMILFILMAIVVTLVCILFTVVVIVVYFVCFVTDSMQTQQDSFSKNFKGLISNAQMNTLINTCIWDNGDGDLMAALGVKGQDTNSFTSMIDSATAIQTFFDAFDSKTTPPVIGAIDGNFTNYKTFLDADEGTPSDQNILAAIKAFNDLKCGTDTMALNGKCPAGATVSQTTDGAAVSKGNNYCFQLNTYPTDYATPKTRYSAGDCTGDVTKANAYLTAIYTSKNDYSGKMNTAQTNTDYVNTKTAILDLFNNIKGSKTDLDAILTQLKSASDSMKNIGTTLGKAINCQILNKGIRVIENVLCYRMANKMYLQSGVGAALGFFLFLYSWCICCSLRLANAKQENKGDAQPQQVQPQPYSDPNGQPPQEMGEYPPQAANEYK